MSLDVMKQALEALEDAVSAWRAEMEFRSCIDAAEPWAKAAESLRAAIEQEPVAWMYVNTDGECEQIEYSKNEPMPDDPSVTPLYTAPRQWQGLTDEEIAEMHNEIKVRLMGTYKTEDIYRAIEAKLKEKNT